MSTLTHFALACNSLVLKEVLAVMFENDNEHDFNLVIDMHTKLNDLGIRIRQRAELILDVEKQGYSEEVFETVKLLKDLQETDNAKARSFMKVINETELKILEKISLIVQFLNKTKWEHLQGLSKSRNYVPAYTLSGFVWSFKIWILESFECSYIWWNRDPKIIPSGLAWSMKQLFKRSDYSLLFGKDSRVNLDLTPTISEQQTIWYTVFRKFYMSYIPRSPPTTYTDLFDDYIKKLSSSRKRGKIDTRDLLIIRRCDTTSVEEIRLKDGVVAKLNSRVFKLEAIIKIITRGAKDAKDAPGDDSQIITEQLPDDERFVSQNFARGGSEEWGKRKDAQIINGKRTQRSSAFSVYYWGNTFAKAEKDRPLNTLNDQDMNIFLKDDTPWVEDLSRYNRATDRVHLTDVFDIFLGRQGPLRCRFRWIMDEHVELWVNYMWHFRPHDADWAMVGAYFVQLLLQDSIPSWYADGSLYKVSWCDVEQVFIPINETDEHWCLAHLHIRTGLVTFYDSGVTYDPEWREWYISLRECLKAKIPEVMMQAKVFDQKGIDHTRYTISYTNAMNVPKQGGVFGDCGTDDRGCGYFMWEDDFRNLISSSVPSTPTTSYNSPSYSTGTSKSAMNVGKVECPNCKFLAEKIKTLEANIKILEGTLEMERHPENHTIESAAILQELYNDMGKLGLE
ncbi:phospholipase-like protein [Tanacetum coccineum]